MADNTSVNPLRRRRSATEGSFEEVDMPDAEAQETPGVASTGMPPQQPLRFHRSSRLYRNNRCRLQICGDHLREQVKQLLPNFPVQLEYTEKQEDR